VGRGATASGPNSVAIGDGSTASADGAVAVGKNVEVSQADTVSFGTRAFEFQKTFYVDNDNNADNLIEHDPSVGANGGLVVRDEVNDTTQLTAKIGGEITSNVLNAVGEGQNTTRIGPLSTRTPLRSHSQSVNSHRKQYNSKRTGCIGVRPERIGHEFGLHSSWKRSRSIWAQLRSHRRRFTGSSRRSGSSRKER